MHGWKTIEKERFNALWACSRIKHIYEDKGTFDGKWSCLYPVMNIDKSVINYTWISRQVKLPLWEWSSRLMNTAPLKITCEEDILSSMNTCPISPDQCFRHRQLTKKHLLPVSDSEGGKWILSEDKRCQGRLIWWEFANEIMVHVSVIWELSSYYRSQTGNFIAVVFQYFFFLSTAWIMYFVCVCFFPTSFTFSAFAHEQPFSELA